MKTLPLKPIMSEKAYGQSETLRTYVFEVPQNSNKQMIANAVAQQFNVEIVSINTLLHKGKIKRTYKKGGKSILGRRTNAKKAYVRIKDGQSIPIFEAMKKTEKDQEEQSEKIKAAIDKKTAKEDKRVKKERA